MVTIKKIQFCLGYSIGCVLLIFFLLAKMIEYVVRAVGFILVGIPTAFFMWTWGWFERRSVRKNS